MIKAKKVGTLYFMEGTTITGSAAVASSTSDSDITKLWHMSLQHMIKRGMIVLSKKGLQCGQSTNNVDFCEDCVFSKQKRLSFSRTVHNTEGKPANYSGLQVFGYPFYGHVNEGKIESRAKKCIFLGYASGVKGYRL
ncbi:putative mitochondrial protein AtMg00300 [Carex rostrata]